MNHLWLKLKLTNIEQELQALHFSAAHETMPFNFVLWLLIHIHDKSESPYYNMYSLIHNKIISLII